MPSRKSPTAVRRQGFKIAMVSDAVCSSEATVLTLENQRHSPVEWLAARANVALSTARLHAELFGIGGACS